MKVIITGGAGFIGANAAARFISRGAEVVVLDNLSRAGSEHNLEWLRGLGRMEFEQADIRDAAHVAGIFEANRDASMVLHLAAQVAVTSSIGDPRTDFEVNALGTLNVLEAMRRAAMTAPLVYSSTNKVYGTIEDARVIECDKRYAYADLPDGVSEERPLDFHSPYGCSKGAADQYVRDYHRIYGLQTVIFRQSCVYGPRQFGVEDQGWVAWFTIAAQQGRPITLYGDGKQVRDVLFVEDLLDAFEAAAGAIHETAGRAYNIGGGRDNAISLHDLIAYLEVQQEHSIHCSFANWRPGDQRVYVSDIRRAAADFGWRPRVGWRAGLAKLYAWVASTDQLFTQGEAR